MVRLSLNVLFTILLLTSLAILPTACSDGGNDADDDDTFDDDDAADDDIAVDDDATDDDNDTDDDATDDDGTDDDAADDDAADDDATDDDAVDDDATDDDATDDDAVDDDATDDDAADDDATDDDAVDDDATDDDTVIEEAEWTFIVYMAADNSLYSYGLGDLNEMKSVGSTDDVNILVVFDGIVNNDSRIYKVEKNSTTVLATPGELNMGDGQTVRTWVTSLIQDYPAKNYGVVFWNHGSGWHDDEATHRVYKSVCQDGSDWLENDELDSAIAYVRSQAGIDKIDLIGFDACLMQMVEIAYYLKDDGEVMVGSEETEGGDGWAYDDFLDDLVDTPTMTPATLGEYIVSSYVDQPDATLSVLTLSQMSSLATAIDAFADTLNAVGGISNSSVETAFGNTLYFADYDYIDLYDFAAKIKAQNISTDINNAATALQTAVDSAVSYYDYGYFGYGNARGVSIYFPDPDWSTFDSDYLDLTFAQDTDWDDVIH